jgi:hypothetical protein
MVFGLIALFERWNMKQYDALYQEIILFLENESNKRANHVMQADAAEPRG